MEPSDRLWWRNPTPNDAHEAGACPASTVAAVEPTLSHSDALLARAAHGSTPKFSNMHRTSLQHLKSSIFFTCFILFDKFTCFILEMGKLLLAHIQPQWSTNDLDE
ncbi:hypothetical protein RHMOL_Rhmol05G0074200 [Rhododendron molle]|uniref:Uncharacterized protein n=1 Tax=Rhododendron molle TaxID=49168 RepID=A0ACC0NMZ1_RHOML|nr:hypothetical protein RHMOL_Rhmol05G0074200 [Rhododendron molle]